MKSSGSGYSRHNTLRHRLATPPDDWPQGGAPYASNASDYSLNNSGIFRTEGTGHALRQLGLTPATRPHRTEGTRHALRQLGLTPATGHTTRPAQKGPAMRFDNWG